jgi:hypothetical protein
MSENDRPRCTNEPGSAARSKCGSKLLDPTTLRANARQEKDRSRHELPHPADVLWSCGANNRTDVRKLADFAKLVHDPSDLFPKQTTTDQLKILEIARPRIRGPNQHEDTCAGCTSTSNEHVERVATHIWVGRQGVGTEAVNYPERRICGAYESLAVGGSTYVNVPSFSIGEHKQARFLGMRNNGAERAAAVRSKALKTGQLRLNHYACWACGVNQRTAVRLNRAGSFLGRARAGRLAGCLGPEPCWVWVKSEHDLRFALSYCRRNPDGETVVRAGLRPRLLAGQRSTA